MSVARTGLEGLRQAHRRLSSWYGFRLARDSKRKEKIMRTTKLRNPMLTNLVLIAVSILAAPAVKAECGAAHNGNALAPQLRNFQEPVAQDDGDFSDEVGSLQAPDEEKRDSRVTILGLWKKVYFSGGV